jgi:hypothetical protein
MASENPIDEAKLAQGQRMVEAYQQLIATATILHDDLAFSAELLNRDGDQFWRRALIRAFFAQVEGMTNCLRRIAFDCRFQPNVNFSLSEEVILSQESYELDDKGEVKTKQVKTPLLSYIKFCFKAYARAHLAEYELNVGDSRWDDFRRSVKIRDRLMHPKSSTDLKVSDEEMEMVHRAYSWFDECVLAVSKLSEKVLSNNVEGQLKQE